MKRALNIIAFYSVACGAVGVTAYVLAHEVARKITGNVL
jgi:hypothetical protein